MIPSRAGEPGPRLVRDPLRRDPTTAQFGVEVSSALVLDGLGPPLWRLLGGLDGLAPGAAVVADAVAHGARPDEVAHALAELGRGGLLGPRGAGASAYVRVHGAGRLGVAVATLLAGAGIGRVAVRAAGSVGRGDLGTGLTDADLDTPAVAAAAHAVSRVVAGVAVAEPTRRRPDLVVLTGRAAGDLVAAAPLHARHQPHLAVTAGETTGTVGPLVLPGRTSCLRCADRHRTDADPAWPRVAAQLAAVPPPVPVAVAGAVAGLAVAQVLAHLVGGPDLTGAAVELEPATGRATRVERPVHPRCPCTGHRPPRAGVVGPGDNR